VPGIVPAGIFGNTLILTQIGLGAAVQSLHALQTMVSRRAQDLPPIIQDGFGTRVIEQMPTLGRVERLTLSPALATPGSEQAIRARAGHLTRLGPGPVGRVLRIERKGATLSILSQMPDGVTLSDILAALEFGTLTLSDEEVLELAASVVQAAGKMHETLGTLAHGALSSAHVVVTREGSTVFTGAVFGEAVQALRRNREQLWREFGLVVPAAANAPKFDQRGDVTQLGALVLAIGQRRSLGRDEGPRSIGDLVMTTSIGSSSRLKSRLRTWLQDTLQLHGRVVFDTCGEAARKLSRFLPKGCGDETGALALRTAVLQLCGDQFKTRLSGDQFTTSPGAAPWPAGWSADEWDIAEPSSGDGSRPATRS
jgi:hypothetical protein